MVSVLVATCSPVSLAAPCRGPDRDAAARFRARVPQSHVAFLKSRPLSATFGDYFFVHAGARPGIPLDACVQCG